MMGTVNPTTEYYALNLDEDESSNGAPEWRPVINATVIPDVYEVSSTGLVSNKTTGKLLKTREAPNSTIKIVSLKGTSNSGVTSARIDKLILEAFVGPAPSGQVPLYLDGNKANAVLSNLTWGPLPKGERMRVRERNVAKSKKRAVAQRYLETDVQMDRRYRYHGVTATVHEDGSVELSISGTRNTMNLSAATFSSLAKVTARVEEMNQLLSGARVRLRAE